MEDGIGLAYNPANSYSIVITGTGQPLSFNYHDDKYSDNVAIGGSTPPLSVQITPLTPPPAGSSVHHPPVFTSSPILVAHIGEPYVYQAIAYDVDGDPLTYAIAPGTANMNELEPTSNYFAIDSSTGLVTWTPTVVVANRSFYIDLQVTSNYVVGGESYSLTADQVYNVVVVPPVGESALSCPPKLVPAENINFRSGKDRQFDEEAFFG